MQNIDINKLIEYRDIVGPIRNRYSFPKNLSDRFKAIRDIYEYHFKDMEANHNISPSLFFSPYMLNWEFTPIERIAWNHIRCEGSLAMYPQYPVGKFYVDFGNPFLKVGLELDGKEFHEESKDIKRDKILKDLGWKIYRIKGRECFSDLSFTHVWDDMEDNHSLERRNALWFKTTCEGVISAISIVHFNNKRYPGYFLDALNTLNEHCYLDHNEEPLFETIKNNI